jgi:succinate dehydrogenase flavin-adding protein (antitoxin of CptAB toxin-antitoxin module)
MATNRKVRIVLAVLTSIIVISAGAYFALSYFARRLQTSDLLWNGTKEIGFRLIVFADEHGGQFPATLEDKDFTNMLTENDKAFIKYLQAEYSQPTGHDTNVVKLLVAHSRWETITFYSDAHAESSRR